VGEYHRYLLRAALVNECGDIGVPRDGEMGFINEKINGSFLVFRQLGASARGRPY